MLPEPLQVALDLLVQFTGDGDGQRPAIVPYGIAGMMWLGLLIVSRFKYRPHDEPHEALLVWGFAFGLARELFMLAVKVAEAYAVVTIDQLHVVFPPAEQALSDVSQLVVASAYMLYLVGNPEMVRRYLFAGVASVVCVYVATFWWWAEYIIANPDSTFGQTWCDWAFRVNVSAWLAGGVVYLWLNSSGWIRNYVCVALGMFFLNDFLKIPDMALGEVYEGIFAPIRHALYLIGIPILGYVYLREHSMEVLSSFESLETTVQARTKDLAAALDGLSVANTRLRDLARIDPLTGLGNRRAFDEDYAKLHAGARRTGIPISVLLIDLDHFKRVNDTHGHQAGDSCLRQVGALLHDSFKRRDDVVARYGGEEFVAVIAGLDPASVLELAEAVRERVAETPFETDEGAISITTSIGIAHAVPDPRHDPQALIMAADDALYAAKKHGRNRVSVAGADTP